MERGAGLPPVERIAYLAELAGVQLADVEHLILVDYKAPVSFFTLLAGRKSSLVADVEVRPRPSDRRGLPWAT
ncbi:MAG: hypothetical protein R3F38_18865 [Gammaproteobacteria bacterium]